MNDRESWGRWGRSRRTRLVAALAVHQLGAPSALNVEVSPAQRSIRDYPIAGSVAARLRRRQRTNARPAVSEAQLNDEDKARPYRRRRVARGAVGGWPHTRETAPRQP